ncbi:uncharacterized protein LOC110979913 [Acanthaster planci]|uniref:Uncharacterized protein LOC110979913 n=1 Tax=Acanthaster planci TaxID=133434 RepID=A0A8B7YJN4_ACAPL|nr:uncharacterized protein LOC110979913 [Acanthaster planci]
MALACGLRLVILLLFIAIVNLPTTDAIRIRVRTGYRGTRRTYTRTVYTNSPNQGLEAWKIALIVFVSLLGIVVLYICVRCWLLCRERRSAEMEVPRVSMNPIYRPHPLQFHNADSVDKDVLTAPPPSYEDTLKVNTGDVNGIKVADQ